MKSLKALLLGLLLVFALAGCGQEEFDGLSIPESQRQREKVEELTLVVTEADFPLLEECTSLQTLNLTGSTCYEAIENYIAAHPQVQVIYTVAVGELQCEPGIRKLELEDGSFDLQGLMSSLKHLPKLTELHLPKTTLMNEDLNYIRQAFPQLAVHYTVELLGQEHPADLTELDLTAMTDGDLEAVLQALPMFPGLERVKLSDEQGNSAMSMATAGYLMDGQPGLQYDYCINLFGQILSRDAESVDLTGIQIGDEGAGRIREALSVLHKCTYMKLEDCGMSNEVLDSIRKEFPNTKIVWRIDFARRSFLTDTEVIRAVYHVEDSHVPLLKYFPYVKYIDMGHNVTLSDLSFVQYMPDLEIMIASGSVVKNLEGFENCKKLEFLELAYCYALTDVTPLAQCPNLQYLNLSFTAVKDLTCLYDLPLKRFLCLDPNPNWESQEAFKAEHPECWIRFTGENPYSLGWRYDDIGETFSDIYLKVRDVFDLDAVDRAIDRQQAAMNPPAANTPPADTPPAEVEG